MKPLKPITFTKLSKIIFALVILIAVQIACINSKPGSPAPTIIPENNAEAATANPVAPESSPTVAQTMPDTQPAFDLTAQAQAMEDLLGTPMIYDACTLVSPEEAAIILGGEITQTENDPGDYNAECKYTAQVDGAFHTLKIEWEPKGGADSYKFWKDNLGVDETGMDVGQEYFITKQITGTLIFVYQSSQFLSIELNGHPDPFPVLKTLAGQILAQNP